jgi:hypothetical protein
MSSICLVRSSDNEKMSFVDERSGESTVVNREWYSMSYCSPGRMSHRVSRRREVGSKQGKEE